MTEITVVGVGGEYMESVVVVEWHKQVGDLLKVGDLVVTVETAKAATEIEATVEGVLSEIRAKVGDEVPVGAVLGIIGDDVAKNELPKATTAELQPASPAEVSPAGAMSLVKGAKRVVASPLARRVATLKQIDLSKIQASSPSGRIKLRDVEAYADAEEATRAAPVDAGMARIGGDIDELAPSAKLSQRLSIQSRGSKDGETLVLLHGFGGDSLSWQPLLAALGGGFRFILVDLPAHGRSPRFESGMSVHDIAEMVSAELVAEGIDDFHLVGHSLGGAVSLALVARGRLSIRSLTLLAPAGLGPEIDGGFVLGFARASRVESLTPWQMKLFADPALASPALVAATMQARSDVAMRAAQIRLAESVFPDGTQAADLRDVLKNGMIPQKIIWGEQDRIIPMQHALRIGGQTALHFLPSVGHMPQLEAPAIVARLLAENIRSAS